MRLMRRTLPWIPKLWQISRMKKITGTGKKGLNTRLFLQSR
jgi:hypothetical protein